MVEGTGWPCLDIARCGGIAAGVPAVAARGPGVAKRPGVPNAACTCRLGRRHRVTVRGCDLLHRL